MRCRTCGLPLSPTRTRCPRCGTIALGGEEKGITTSSGVVSSLLQDMFQAPDDAGKGLAHPSLAARLFHKRSPRFHLTVAALCVLTGAILLITVFLLSLDLPSPSPETTAQTRHASPSAHTHVASTASPTPSPGPTMQPTGTPTRGFPGQQYIDNAQMASAVNFSTAQPLQFTTKFYRNQRIYVTFALHPGRSGAACLLWYLNKQQFTTYSFPAENVSISAYSYAISGIPGSGYVEIYWADSTACTNKLLAQRVSFTVL